MAKMMTLRRCIWGCAVLTAGLCWTGRAQATNGPGLTTIGSKGPVTLPIDGDGQSAFRMPSSIGFNYGSRIDLDVFFAYIRSEFSNRLNDFEGSSVSPGGTIGAVFAPGRPDFENDPEAWDNYSEANKWTFHIGEYIELASGGSTRVRSQAFPEGVKTSTDLLFLTTAATVAYTPTEWLSVGASFHFIFVQVGIDTLAGGGDSISLNGSPQIAGVALPGNPTYADFLQLFSNDNASDPTTRFQADLTSYQLGGNFSFSIKPTDNIAFGLAYSPRTYSPEYETDATVNANRTVNNAIGGLDPIIQQLFLATLPNGGNQGFVTQYKAKIKGVRLPRRIRGSVAWWARDNLLFAAEVAWIEWHRALKEVTIEASNGTNTDLNFVVGNPSLTTRVKLRLRNQFVFSFYTAYGVTRDFTLRAGVNYGKSPFNTTTTGNGPNPGFVDLNLSAGFGYNITRNLEFNFLMEYGVANSESADGSPDSATAKFTRYNSEQAFFHFGIGYKF